MSKKREKSQKEEIEREKGVIKSVFKLNKMT